MSPGTGWGVGFGGGASPGLGGGGPQRMSPAKSTLYSPLSAVAIHPARSPRCSAILRASRTPGSCSAKP
jgi:hypothetical protein